MYRKNDSTKVKETYSVRAKRVPASGQRPDGIFEFKMKQYCRYFAYRNPGFLRKIIYLHRFGSAQYLQHNFFVIIKCVEFQLPRQRLRHTPVHISDKVFRRFKECSFVVFNQPVTAQGISRSGFAGYGKDFPVVRICNLGRDQRASFKS